MLFCDAFTGGFTGAYKHDEAKEITTAYGSYGTVYISKDGVRKQSFT